MASKKKAKPKGSLTSAKVKNVQSGRTLGKDTGGKATK